MKGICVNFIDLGSFSDSLWDVTMTTDFGKNLQLPSFNTLAFGNGFEYRNSESHVIKGNIFATLCAILVMIGPLNYAGVYVTFRTSRQKPTYLTKSLSKYWTKLHQLFSIGRLIYEDYKTEISFAADE